MGGAVIKAVKVPSWATVIGAGTVVMLLPAKVTETVSPAVNPVPESFMSVSAGPLIGEMTMLAPGETTIRPSGTALNIVLVPASRAMS